MNLDPEAQAAATRIMAIVDARSTQTQIAALIAERDALNSVVASAWFIVSAGHRIPSEAFESWMLNAGLVESRIATRADCPGWGGVRPGDVVNAVTPLWDSVFSEGNTP